MTNSERIQRINVVLEEFFSNKYNPPKIKAKDLMPLFIEKGIFGSDYKNGLPIRNLLRDLDEQNNLSAIPYVVPERKLKNTSWFFVNTNPVSPIQITSISKDKIETCNHYSRQNSDEFYVVSLCNEVLGKTALQQHKFDFLKGDSGISLPVDAYYEELNLVVEYCESQHSQSTPFFDRKMTVSGVSRGEQRKIYDERRRTILPQHGIKVINIHYSDFGTNKRIKRNYERDIEIIRLKLHEFL